MNEKPPRTPIEGFLDKPILKVSSGGASKSLDDITKSTANLRLENPSGVAETKKLPRTREQITDDLLALVGFLNNEIEKLRIVSGQDNNKEQRLAVVAQLEEDMKTLQSLMKELTSLKPPREL